MSLEFSLLTLSAISFQLSPRALPSFLKASKASKRSSSAEKILSFDLDSLQTRKAKEEEWKNPVPSKPWSQTCNLKIQCTIECTPFWKQVH